MAATCTICAHPKRKEIETAHLGHQPLSRVAREFRVSRYSVRRHLEAHLSERMAKAAEKKEIAAGSDLLERLLELNKVSRAILADAYKAGERDTALRAIARLESQLELEARLIGEIKDRQVNVQNVIVDPETAERMARMYLARRGMLESQIAGAATIVTGAVANNGEGDEPRDAEDR
jgi:hypothetical protein